MLKKIIEQLVKQAYAQHFHHIDGKDDPADILSKHCDFSDTIGHIKPISAWEGDTIYCLRNRPTDTGQRPKGSDKIGTVNSERTVNACRHIVHACTVQSQFGHWPYLDGKIGDQKIASPSSHLFSHLPKET